ncbi:4-(cytidine 5'-diphospho)-2-C-methyl-D-erythritol kinase [Labrys wisconsinensis]|uniref:4-diphosphocytidyl-2-C-methyl-D-erythritol kinase n=1 Tax=Labrys wisconsinensis TaxID=425677 RepID=A0ABU0JAS1_9HYPH|nr:4-(cytidine 5'-diphospho)-2-C-methyl-D-erythritol kinase [Labrys wisconsinensis]MDQ0470369.1 4-diphosphocytidyl-2-C-methyl-D-erythritol kinase [Labrys wisconsinensis]
MSLGPLTERAPAKVNLTLHVLGRRADGYHLLDSLVAFAARGDTLTLEPGPGLSLRVTGPTAKAAGEGTDNLVIRAAQALLARLPGLDTGRFHLLKRLPVAAGIGGGSSDAAAALRLLARANRLAPDDPHVAAAAREVGADVPVCLEARTRLMGGAGETLFPPLALPRLPTVLVNPRVPAPTAAVFRALGLQPGATIAAARQAFAEGLTRRDLIAVLREARNDLEAPAIAVAPVVREAIDLIGAQPTCRLARMSGSGATVFGLFDSCRAAAAAARALRAARPGWWVATTMVG